jgi:hypothetical protein
MRDMEMITTSRVSLRKRDNCRNRSPGEFGGQNSQNQDVEQCYVIKFFSDEGMPRVQIIARLRQHYGENTLSRTQVYFWTNEVKRGRANLNTIASAEREPNEGLTAVIAGKLDVDHHLSDRKLAQFLGMAVSTVS